jgi:hypothetical protein
LVANQVVCVELCFFFVHREMIRFLGAGCVTSVSILLLLDAFSPKNIPLIKVWLFMGVFLA